MVVADPALGTFIWLCGEHEHLTRAPRRHLGTPAQRLRHPPAFLPLWVGAVDFLRWDWRAGAEPHKVYNV